MNKKTLTIIGVLSSLICIAGGVWSILAILKVIDDDLFLIGIGIYFIGKGLFVGPMLISNAKD